MLIRASSHFHKNSIISKQNVSIYLTKPATGVGYFKKLWDTQVNGMIL